MDSDKAKGVVDAWWEQHFAPSAPTFSQFNVIREKKEILKEMLDAAEKEEA